MSTSSTLPLTSSTLPLTSSTRSLTFSELPLLPSLRETLAEKKLEALTEIQSQAVPALLEGRSVVGVAETGSGKTLAFALPLLHLLKTLEDSGDAVEANGRPRAVVVVPTRELGDQVARVMKPFTHTTRLRVRSALGGTDLATSKRSVAGPVDILVGTPGRLIKLMEIGLLELDDVRVLVFDEADQMLDQGFFPAAMRIATACRPGRQLALFSATVGPKIQELIEKLFSGAQVIRSQGSHQLVSGLSSRKLDVPDGKRFPLLETLLHDQAEGGTMIFTNTREQCDKLAKEMKTAGFASATYRGDMDRVERKKNLKLFREGKIGFLISTDLASRGLDVEHVGRVINYHLPQQVENYIHRVGRTARAGRKGLVIDFVTERDARLVAQIEKLRSRASSAAAKLDSARDWPDEPVHQKPVPKIVPAAVRRTGMILKVRERIR